MCLSAVCVSADVFECAFCVCVGHSTHVQSNVEHGDSDT